MEEKVAACLETIGKAIKELITSANSEAEMIGLMTLVFAGWEETFKKAIDEGVDELEKREEEEGN